MATFNRTFISIETTDGEFKTARVMFSDQVQYEKTARARGWSPERDQAISNMFIAYNSMKRAGLHELSWDDFQEWAIDVQVNTEKVDTDTGQVVGEDAEDPTL